MKRSDDSLSEYNRRRDFAKTAEPAGKRGRSRTKTLSFLVQKHDATRLHYDLRLEWKGVLKSWAVTRGPSVDPEDKRLAVRTEDHPMSYGSFEGTIPQHEYGGGTVMLWDRGSWEPLHDPEEGLKEGKLHFNIHGERMTGGWALVRMQPRGKEKRENWLLIKERDAVAEAVEAGKGDVLIESNMTSVKTGRTMDEIAEGKAAAKAKAAAPKTVATPRKSAARKPAAAAPKRTRPLPKFRSPQLATLVDTPPTGDDWLHEVKFDGYRLLVAIGSGGVRCYTRTGLDWTAKFPRIAAAFKSLECDSALIDGEVTAENTEGLSAFSALQKAIKSEGVMQFYAFDLLTLDGQTIASKPLEERKESLEALLGTLPKEGVIHFSDHVRGNGEKVFAAICDAGREGIIAKKATSRYSGTRNRDWLKIKCTRRQEFVIGGYSPSDKKGRPFRSLLVGTMENGNFVYRGRVGTGFSEDTLASLGRLLAANAQKTKPFAAVPRDVARTATWVAPKIVAEIDFNEFTDDGHVRHGVFIGLREDKEAKAVTLESKPVPDGTKPAKSTGKAAGSKAATVLGVTISSPDRVVFPKQGVTKMDLATYYGVVAERMLAHAADHPMSLVRCPQGRNKQCFYQKHASDGFPDAIRQVPIKESSGDTENYLYVADGTGIVSAVQMGTLEFHIWGATIDRLEKPDRLVFDLDPDESLTFADVRKAAFQMRDELDAIGLKTVLMVTGGKGVHVIVPLQPRAEWPDVKSFAKAVAVRMAEAEPERYVATMSKAKRKGRIFIDWLRNDRGATAIAPYSTRAREGAPVATPISWDELGQLKAANSFTIAKVMKRVEADDPWQAAAGWKQSLTRKMLTAVGVA